MGFKFLREFGFVGKRGADQRAVLRVIGVAVFRGFERVGLGVLTPGEN